MREQTKRINELLDEFRKLNQELFNGHPFVEMDPKDKRWERHAQLQAFFYPAYRGRDWVNPFK